MAISRTPQSVSLYCEIICVKKRKPGSFEPGFLAGIYLARWNTKADLAFDGVN